MSLARMEKDPKSPGASLADDGLPEAKRKRGGATDELVLMVAAGWAGLEPLGDGDAE